MRILLVTPMPPNPQAPGAIPVLLHAQLTGLLRRHEVAVVTVAGPEREELAALDALGARGVEVHGVRRAEPRGLGRWRRRWRLGGTWLRGRYPWRTVWFWEPGVQRILDRLARERRFDLVQMEDSATGIYRYPARVPAIFTEYEVRRPRPVDWRGWSPRETRSWAWREADWRRWRRYQLSIWRRYDRLQAFGERDAAAMRSLAPDLAGRIRVNPFPVQLGPPPDPRSEVPGQLLFVGNFTHEPNVDAALWLGREIMPLLRARAPGAHLTVVGIYPPERVRALASADITVAGPVPAIEPYLGRASVVLAPIRIGGGMRMKVLQAMAHGKAVVTTPRGAEGLASVGARPPLAIAGAAEDFAESTARLLGDEAERHALGRRAWDFVAEHLSPEAYARRQEAIYAELLPGEMRHGAAGAGR